MIRIFRRVAWAAKPGAIGLKRRILRVWVASRALLSTFCLLSLSQTGSERPRSTHAISGIRIAQLADYCSFSYSARACLRIGTSGSPSFHSLRKS